MGTSVFTGRGVGASGGGVSTSRVIYSHADIIAGATPKTAVVGISSSIIIPITFSVQRPLNGSSNYGVNASFTLRYIGAVGVNIGTLTPQLQSLNQKYYAYEARLAGAWNNVLSPSGIGLEIVSTGNSGGTGGTTVLYFDVTYIQIAPVALE